MPVRNEEVYLKDCIDSIIVQSEPNWELIVVDDSSIDNTYNILQQYTLSDSRIKAYRSPGTGIIDALRTGFSYSSGDYITRMDGDDIMEPNKLELLKKALVKAGPRHVATGLVKYFSSDGIAQGYKRYADWLNKLTLAGNNFEDKYKECCIPSPCWMMYRSEFIAIGGFQKDIYPEDYDLCFRMASAKLNIATVSEIIHHWRDYDERTSRNDPNYADQTFMDIKLNHFLKEDHIVNQQLYIWGVGKKGKYAAKFLNEKKIAFKWICNNPKKIGHIIYNVQIESDQILLEKGKQQIIILVASPDDQLDINNRMLTSQLTKNSDYYFFC